MKRKLLILSVLAICIATFAVGTLAYVSSEVTTHNVITTGGVDIELQEWADEKETIPFENVSGVMPDTSVTKIVRVENKKEKSAEAWIRVKVEKKIDLDLENNKAAEGVTADTSLVVLDINTADWELKDGYYYYKHPVKPGETTSPLFKNVYFDKTMDNAYQNATATVSVYAQAVQTANNGTTWDTVKPASWPKGTTSSGVSGAVTG